MSNLLDALNPSALEVFEETAQLQKRLRVKAHTLSNGARVLDCGVNEPGGLSAGVQLARICLAGMAEVNVTSGDEQVWPGPWIQVATDFPVEACMLGQYAGWPVSSGEFFAMGSGPMRVKRGKEELLLSLGAKDSATMAVGTLECDTLVSDSVAQLMAAECGVDTSQLYIAVAPTRSIAGCVQVVARSIETAMHKMHELKFDLSQIVSGYGIAPLCPPSPNMALGIGRTNDAILYGGQVTLWVDAEDEQIVELGPKVPSCSSEDFGRPFAEIFKEYDYDFYKVDPGLFSPAVVTLVNLRSGKSWRFGAVKPDLIAASFSTEVVQ